MAIVEVAVQVNGEDVRRVVQRAEGLRRAGVQAMPVVIGEDWATLDTRERARVLGVTGKWVTTSRPAPGFSPATCAGWGAARGERRVEVARYGTQTDVFLRQRGGCLVHDAVATEVVLITSVEKPPIPVAV